MCLMSHSVTDSVVYPPMGSTAMNREISTPPTLQWGMAPLPLPYYKIEPTSCRVKVSQRLANGARRYCDERKINASKI